MPTRKKSQASTKKAGTRSRSGAVPPYGDPIREAIARGDLQEMRRVALSARQYVSRVQSALEALEKAIAKSRS